VLHSGSVRRRQTGVLVVGAAEPQVHPWLRAMGCETRAAADLDAALSALGDAPADLVLVGAEAGGRDVTDMCRALGEDPRREEAWLLAIATKGRLADAALAAGADDYLHRPFTRGELLARARAGLRAAQQRADDKLVRALMVHVPGAIYRSAWHNDYALELISDEIERISGYPPHNFIASRRRTIMSIIHPDDREQVIAAAEEASRRGEPFEFEYRIVRADGEIRWVLDRGHPVPGPGGRLWMDGAIVDVTDRRAAEEALRAQQIEHARTEELRASRVRIVQAADAARRKIERDLHDGAQQRLVSLALEVRLARSQVEKDPAVAPAFLERFGEELLEASAELRELARGIHPAVLTERGLSPALAALAARAPVPVEVLDTPGERLPSALETTAYFTVAEALTNVAKYAEATYATVRVACDDGALVVEVRDDGVGGADAGSGSGLSGLLDRVEACDGSLEVESPPGAGTLVRAVLPLPVASGA
jgi:PAS domain S-box-containing protein